MNLLKVIYLDPDLLKVIYLDPVMISIKKKEGIQDKIKKINLEEAQEIQKIKVINWIINLTKNKISNVIMNPNMILKLSIL